jgi:DNA helicase HerA-like ATPase
MEMAIDFIDSADDEESYFVEYIPDGELDVDFSIFGRMLWKYGDLVLVVDEANELQSPAASNNILSRYIRRAPRREKGEADPVDIIQTSHFPVDFHKTSFGLADEAWIFRLTRERDIQRIRNELGDDVADAVMETRTPEMMPPGRDVVHVNIVTREFEVVTDSDSWNAKIYKSKEGNSTYVA